MADVLNRSSYFTSATCRKRIASMAICGLLISLTASAQSNRAHSVDLAGIAHVAFRVASVEATRDFYKRLGFEEAFVFSKDGQITQDFIKINDTQFIELYPELPANLRAGFMHICFEASDLPGLNRSYRERGLSPSPVKTAGAGNLLFTLRGPEDQNIEYTQYMPGSLHDKDRSRHLGEGRISRRLQTVAITMRDEAAAESFYTGKLSFRAVDTANKSVLLLPGNSGQSVAFKQPGSKGAPDITLEVDNLRAATHMLRSRGFAVTSAHRSALITDPDGIVIEFSPKSSLTRSSAPNS